MTTPEEIARPKCGHDPVIPWRISSCLACVFWQMERAEAALAASEQLGKEKSCGESSSATPAERPSPTSIAATSAQGTIADLRAQLQASERELDIAARHAVLQADAIKALKAKLEASERALERVREALKDCIESLAYVNSHHRDVSGWGVRDELIQKAIAALASPGSPQE